MLSPTFDLSVNMLLKISCFEAFVFNPCPCVHRLNFDFSDDRCSTFKSSEMHYDIDEHVYYIPSYKFHSKIKAPATYIHL